MYIKFENDSWEHIMHESLRSDERTTPINEEIKNIFSHWCTRCKYKKYTGECHSPCANCNMAIDYGLGHTIPSEYSYDSSHLYTLYGKYCREFPDHLTVGEFGLPSICPDELCDCAPVHISCGKDNPEDCNECINCWAGFGYDFPEKVKSWSEARIEGVCMAIKDGLMSPISGKNYIMSIMEEYKEAK